MWEALRIGGEVVKDLFMETLWGTLEDPGPVLMVVFVAAIGVVAAVAGIAWYYVEPYL